MNNFYAKLLDFTRDGVYRYGFEDGVIQVANRGLVRILDLEVPPETLHGKRLSDLMRYIARPGEIRKRLQAYGEIHGYEYHFKTLKGEDRWVLHDSFLSRNPVTGEKFVDAIVKDITPIKKASRDSEEERERLSVTLRSIGDGLIATDGEGCVSLMNPVAEQLTGWSLDVARGMPLDQVFCIIDEQTRKPGENPVKRALQTGRTVELANHTTLIARDGRERNIADSASPIRDSTGDIIGVVLVFRDVTEKKRLERALKESEAHYRLLFNSMLDGFALHEIICDDAGKPVDYRFLDVNPRFEALTGLRAKNLIGRTFREALADNDTSWIDIYGRVALTGETVLFERYSEVLKRYYQVTAYRPAERQFATVFVDITEKHNLEENRKRIDTQLQQTQKMETLGTLASGIAHDFNNLLTGVLGNASLALLDIPEGTPAHGCLKEVERAAQRAADLCRQLLAYSGKGRFVVEPLDLSALIEETAGLLQISSSKKTALKYDLTKPMPSISADSSQVRQMLMNLIANATEAIGDNRGLITIATGTMECDQAYLRTAFIDGDLPEGVYAYVEVSDTGCGMDADTCARIFDPFFSTKFTGRGLGLSAIIGIVRAHKGAIKVYSEPGKGSTFKILFPTVNEPATRHRLTPETGAKSHISGTVLVADDDETILSLARRTLERAGARVLTAADGCQAVSLFRQHAGEIRLVVLDMTMPNMNGEEAFCEIRRIRPDAVVLLSSGYNKTDATSRFAGKGLAGFIQKPYRQADLLVHIVETLEKMGPARKGKG